MRYTIEMASGGMIYIPSVVKIGKGVEGILRFCLRSFKSCNIGITEWKGFMKSAVEMGSGGMTYIQSSMTIGQALNNITIITSTI
jgi:hypothetical protein